MPAAGKHTEWQNCLPIRAVFFINALTAFRTLYEMHLPFNEVGLHELLHKCLLCTSWVQCRALWIHHLHSPVAGTLLHPSRVCRLALVVPLTSRTLDIKHCTVRLHNGANCKEHIVQSRYLVFIQWQIECNEVTIGCQNRIPNKEINKHFLPHPRNWHRTMLSSLISSLCCQNEPQQCSTGHLPKESISTISRSSCCYIVLSVIL